MAYNLQSLITILQQILNPEQENSILDDHSKPQLESLLQKAASLKQILENSSVPKLESLETQIRDAAHEAEDLIESYMVDEMRRRKVVRSSFSMLSHIFMRFTRFTQDQMLNHEGTSFTFVTPDLLEVTQELDSAMKKVAELVEEKKTSTGSSSDGAAVLPDPISKTVVVGVDEDLLQLKNRLTNMQSEQLEIVPIVGMGGIGKTTLARKLYDDPLIVSHFDVRAWTTISQDYNVRAILLGLLRRPNEKLSNELIQCQENELIEILRKRLFSRRYIIVLDDIWSSECWDDIKWCFPDNNNGSRIVLTTRESDVARCVGTVGWQHEVRLLEESESWNLLHQIVFGEEDCPDALQGIGRKIVGDCRGLPLAINVIGGVLFKAERSRDIWEHIAKDVRATIAETDKHGFSNVLSLSYNHLPNNLKPCFLYMGAFPEDYEIKASKLIHLLVAEGFLKSNGDKSLEEEAEDSLSALVERNLLLVTRKKPNGKASRYGMHDLLREVCIRKANEEKFLLHVKNGSEVRLDKPRRVSVDTSCGMEDVDAYASAELLSLARSFIWAAPISMCRQKPSHLFSKLRLVRVLDAYEMEFQKFPKEIYQLVNLRYLAVSCESGGIPKGISRLRYLQTLIARVDWVIDLPSEIWEMSELRHLNLKSSMISIEEGYIIKFVRRKLQTLSFWVSITPSLIRSGFFERIPNIKDLGVYFGDELASNSEVVDLTHLHKLQRFRCVSRDGGCRFQMQKLRFPSSLRKLSMHECVISGRFMTTLCALPNLEELRIWRCVFEDNEEWEAAEGDEFRSLQFLRLQELNLVRWRADETNFPRLEQLLIYKCSSLEEIPSGIGEIPTMQQIEVIYSSPSVVASAKQIKEVQQSEFDNYDLIVIY